MNGITVDEFLQFLLTVIAFGVVVVIVLCLLDIEYRNWLDAMEDERAKYRQRRIEEAQERHHGP